MHCERIESFLSCRRRAAAAAAREAERIAGRVTPRTQHTTVGTECNILRDTALITKLFILHNINDSCMSYPPVTRCMCVHEYVVENLGTAVYYNNFLLAGSMASPYAHYTACAVTSGASVESLV